MSSSAHYRVEILPFALSNSRPTRITGFADGRRSHIRRHRSSRRLRLYEIEKFIHEFELWGYDPCAEVFCLKLLRQCLQPRPSNKIYLKKMVAYMGIVQGLAANGNLFAAWKGEPDDDRIFYSSWDGRSKWMPALTIDGNTSVGPSLGVFNGALYAAWKGEWSDPRLFFAKYNGSGWESQAQIANVYSDVGPALCQYNSTTFIAAWKNVFDQNLYYSTYDGHNWSEPSATGHSSSVGPALVFFDGKVWAAWKGAESDQTLWYATYNGANWSTHTQIQGAASSSGPSLAAVGDKLYALWKGGEGDENLYLAYYPYADGQKQLWSCQPSGQVAISGIGSSSGAAISEYQGNLYAICKGKDSDVSLYLARYDGSEWHGWNNDIPGNTGPDPTTLLATPSGSNFNYPMADSQGASVIGATVTVTVTAAITPKNDLPWSFQVNCNGPSKSSGPNAFIWQQYMFAIVTDDTGSLICVRLNCFRAQDEGPETPYLNWDSRAPRLAPGKGSLPLSKNTLPKGSQLTMSLATNGSGDVEGFSFSMSVPGAGSINSPVITLQSIASQVGPENLAPISNFQAILVANNPSGDGTADSVKFSSAQGIFLYDENNNLVATPASDESGESSNIQYGALPASYPNGEFYQVFGLKLS
jgi:hypothetical protein